MQGGGGSKLQKLQLLSCECVSAREMDGTGDNYIPRLCVGI